MTATILTLLSIFFIAAPVGAATTPLEAIKETAGSVLTTLRDPQSRGNPAARQQKIKETLRARFNFEEMGKRSLGPNWSKQTPEDQERFVLQFSDLLMNSYIDSIDNYKGEKIVYQGERRDGANATVDTKIVDPRGQEYKVNYRLEQSAGDWKVYDVIIEDVSIVNNYRSQFSRLLNNGTFAELLQKLSSKQFQAPGAS